MILNGVGVGSSKTRLDEPALGSSTGVRRRPWRARKVVAFILLLLLVAVLVGAFVAFERFQSEIGASNRRVPAATKRALAPARDALSTPQLVLIVFDRASLIVRTDPERRVVSFVSLPGDA